MTRFVSCFDDGHVLNALIGHVDIELLIFQEVDNCFMCFEPIFRLEHDLPTYGWDQHQRNQPLKRG